MRNLLLIIVLPLLVAVSADGATLGVPQDFETVAGALEVAQAGDIVLVQPGTYLENGLVLPDGVWLEGNGSSPEQTILDGEGIGRILTCEGLQAGAGVMNLLFRNGHAQGPTSYDGSGGAVLCSNSNLTITNCRFETNRAQDHGGAVRASHSSPDLSLCVFIGNSADGGGGALDCSYQSSPQVQECEFRNNAAAWGGAVSCRAESHASLEDCVLDGNEAVGSPGMGGAIFTDIESAPVMSRTTVCGNQATYGGGVASLVSSALDMAQCTLVGNGAVGQGAGLFLKGANPTITATLVTFNEGESLNLSDGASPTIQCTDIFGNEGGDWVPGIAGQKDEPGNVELDPLFCSVDAGDPTRFYLQGDSPLLALEELCGELGALPAGCAASAVSGSLAPAALAGLMAHPNPFNPRTRISFELQEAGRVRVQVYDLKGALIRCLSDVAMEVGVHTLVWNGQDAAGRIMAAGTYLVVAETAGQNITTKVALLK